MEKKYLSHTSGVTLTMFTIRRPPAEIFGAPKKYKMLTVSLKKRKKVATIFSCAPWSFLAPPEAFWRPWSFLYPQIYFSPPPNVNLADVWYIFPAK